MAFNFQEFKANYVAPTFNDYVLFLLKPPTMEEAKFWESVNSQGPMTEDEYQHFLYTTGDSKWDKEMADRMLRNRALTTFGWYLDRWVLYFKTLFTYSFSEYKVDHYSSAYDNAVYAEDEYL